MGNNRSIHKQYFAYTITDKESILFKEIEVLNDNDMVNNRNINMSKYEGFDNGHKYDDIDVISESVIFSSDVRIIDKVRVSDNYFTENVY